jgi:CRISPR-associated protein Cas5t
MSEIILRIDLFQPFAQYRNPFTFVYAQSYPLPPKSTIIGMLQNLLNDFNLQEELQFVISGKYEAAFYHYSSFIKGSEISFNENGLKITQDKSMPLLLSQRTPFYQQEIHNMKTTFFIKGREEIIKKIEDKIKNIEKILSLGRSHDIAFIKKIVRVNSNNLKWKKLKDKMIIKGRNILVPCKYFDEKGILLLKALPFFMPSRIDYKIGKGYIYSIFSLNREEVRRKTIFEKIYYLEEGSYIIEEGKEIEVNYYEDRNMKIPLFFW